MVARRRSVAAFGRRLLPRVATLIQNPGHIVNRAKKLDGNVWSVFGNGRGIELAFSMNSD